MTKGRLTTTLCFLSVGLSLMACVSFPRVSPNPSNPIRTVAVLPLVNNTNDVEAPAYVRELITKELPNYFYVIKPLNEVDQILKDRMGVTLGTQLDMTTAQKLGETLGVDGVFYGSLDDFSHKITGVYNVKRVRIRVKLVNCKTGETFWKNGAGVKNVLTAGALGEGASMVGGLQDKQETGEELKPLFGDKIPARWHDLSTGQSKSMGEAFMAGLAEKVVSKALKAPLKQETDAAISILFSGSYASGGWPSGQAVPGGTALPPGPGTGTAVASAMPMVPGAMFEPMAGAMFGYAFNVHGYWLGKKSYRPGEWTRWNVAGEGNKHQLEKAFLKQDSEGKQWWRVAFVEESEPVIFEGYFASGQAELLRLRAKFGSGEASEVPVTKGTLYQHPAELTVESWKGAFIRKESVTVPAGTFQCDYLVYGAMGAGVSEWWLSDQVPGGVVKYLFRESKNAQPIYEISLAKFGQNATTVLSSY